MATYKDAHAYAVEVGDILSKVLNVHITAETLPDGKMYFNIADRVLNETLKNNYSLVSDYTEGVQTKLNQQAGLKLRAQRPGFDQDRVKGFINKLSSADDFADVQWVLGDPMVNFTQSVVDEAIKKNAKFHNDAGMKAVIKRQVKGKACDWCRGLEGTYDYPKGAPNEVFHRHENCRCVTDYLPGDGKKQNVWSKSWKKEAITQREREKQALEDIKSNNGRTDAQEYRKMVKILGPDKMPPSLPKFQELKYNNNEEYRLLRHDFRVVSYFNSPVREELSDSQRRQAVEAYFSFKKDNILFGDHAIARYISRMRRSNGRVMYNYDAVKRIANKEFNYISSHLNRRVKYYNKLMLIYENDRDEVVTFMKTRKLSKKLRKINDGTF